MIGAPLKNTVSTMHTPEINNNDYQGRLLVKSNSFLAVVLLLATMLLTACFHDDGNDSPPPAPQTGTVSGLVISSATGSAISGATVRAGATTTTSAADGSYTLAAGVSERVVIHAEAAGFAETFQVTRVAIGQTAFVGVQLLPVGVTIPVNAATGGTVTVPNSSAQVTLPAGGLVSATGGAPVTTVNVAVTPINPAIDTGLMPGDYTAVSAGGGSPVSIESFGALLVDIRDDNGTRYNLAAGQISTIRIPLGTLSASPPPTIPLFYFNETTGLWVEEGTATLAGTAPNQYYEGTVTHFSFWNADQVMDTVFVTGCVRDAVNQPVANVVVSSDGNDYSGSASTVTAADGSFRVAVRRGGLATLDVLSDRNGNLLDTTVNVGPLTADFTLPSCLVTKLAPFGITTWSLPAGIVGTAYNASLTAFNGTRPYSSWSVSTGTLPTGLTLARATGQISGTPTAAGAFTVTIQAQDSSTSPQLATETFNITIFPVSSGGGESGGGTLTVANAPVSVGGSFVADTQYTSISVQGNTASILWWEIGSFTSDHVELLWLTVDLTTGQGTFFSAFAYADGGTAGAGWACGDALGGTSGSVACGGVTLNRSAGTVSFANQELRVYDESSTPPITLNGTLNFTPF